MARLIGKNAMNHVVSRLPEVNSEIRGEARAGGRRARANLSAARASTTHSKIVGPDGLTRVEVSHGDVDSFFSLVAPNAMAIEFGHAPSGVFGPGGSLGHVPSKPPEGLYILIRAAISGSPS